MFFTRPSFLSDGPSHCFGEPVKVAQVAHIPLQNPMIRICSNLVLGLGALVFNVSRHFVSRLTCAACLHPLFVETLSDMTFNAVFICIGIME